jgi:hypothetical protein
MGGDTVWNDPQWVVIVRLRKCQTANRVLTFRKHLRKRKTFVSLFSFYSGVAIRVHEPAIAGDRRLGGCEVEAGYSDNQSQADGCPAFTGVPLV